MLVCGLIDGGQHVSFGKLAARHIHGDKWRRRVSGLHDSGDGTGHPIENIFADRQNQRGFLSQRDELHG
ncbi:hypothetical protein C7S18_11790 [Ahniella affigens]|uniref:Uncharacterized protein n=1 Tax=Ahniella affigens TaxID=2021234 RepID=A0A2P1PSK8_9GAMM|nr:hypothetical protein C7S18_11790 [Ahniella affigens]